MAVSVCVCRACIAALVLALGLTACGGASGTSAAASPVTSQATASPPFVQSITPGTTPFISLVTIGGAAVQNLTQVEFTIGPRPRSVSRPVHVRYSMAALARQGYLLTDASTVRLPVFGLYAGSANRVLVQLDYQDGSTQSLSLIVPTTPYSDPNAIYDHPTLKVRRAPGSPLGFDFFVMKSALGSPVIVDTDAQIRWVGTGISNSMSSMLIDNGFVIGSPTAPAVYQLGFDGSIASYVSPNPPYVDFHHNIDYGKDALLFEVNSSNSNGVPNIETTLVDMDPDGTIDQTWDLAQILSSYMRSQGDDPTPFVRAGVDWFHMNAAAYDASDDSVLVSSRENFLTKLDYSTGSIKWILGDPTKYWHTFPSLRAKALTLEPGGLYPIGQHAVSITSDGLVMVMNDGQNSINQPAGAPAGETRSFSAVSAYSIDPVNRLAREVWRFDYGQSIFAPFCGSSYEASGGTYLVDFATADSFAHARLVGLDSDHNVVFDFQYPNASCNTGWNATPIALDNFVIL